MQPKIGATRAITERQSGHEVQEAEHFGRFIPWIADQPFVGPLPGEHHFLPAGMNALRQLQQCRARRVDHRRLGGLDQLWIGVQRVAGSELLDDRRLGADVSRHEIGRAEFIEFRSIHANRVSVDRRTLEMAGHGHDHARIHSARQIGAHRHIGPKSFLHGLQH